MPRTSGDRLERQVQVVVQDDDGALIDGQATEAALELVAVDHTGERRGRGRVLVAGGIQARAASDGSVAPRCSRR